MPIHTPKLGFLGYFTSKMVSNVNETPKRHILARIRVVWAIKRENPSTGLTCRWVDEKRYKLNKKIFCYISPICPEAPRGRICTKFNTAVGVVDVITSNKFFGDRCGFSGRSKIAISHWQSQSPLTQGWRYRAARDMNILITSYEVQMINTRMLLHGHSHCWPARRPPIWQFWF